MTAAGLARVGMDGWRIDVVFMFRWRPDVHGVGLLARA
jgi:hypothetical protein